MVAASCLPLLLTAVVDDALVLCGLWAVAGIGNALQLVANSAFVQAVPAHVRGRAFGVAGTLLMAVQGVVLLAAGALAELTGPRVPVAVVAAATLVLVPVLVAASPTTEQSTAEVA
jgi:MFS family permease